MSFPKFPHAKDADDLLDYVWDWTARLAEGEAISASTFEVVEGTVMITDFTINETKTVVWLRGGTEGTTALVLNRINTTGGRQFDQTIGIKIKPR